MQRLFFVADKFVGISFSVLAVQMCLTAERPILAILFQTFASTFRAMHEAKRYGTPSKWFNYYVINFNSMNQSEVYVVENFANIQIQTRGAFLI